jgi:hypothetical protein
MKYYYYYFKIKKRNKKRGLEPQSSIIAFEQDCTVPVHFTANKVGQDQRRLKTH